MIKNIAFSFVFVLLVFYSCKILNKSSQNESKIVSGDVHANRDGSTAISQMRYYEMQNKGVDFFASGNEPFWSLEIGFDHVMRFKTLTGIDSIVVSVSEPEQIVDKSIVRYKGKSDQGEISVTIEMKGCEDSMSGVKKPYVVQVSTKQTNDEKYSEFYGCGEYYGNVRLHDIWALKNLNGLPYEQGNGGQHPCMELHLNNGKVMGMLGCNSFTTSFYLGKDQIFFRSILSTKMACPAIEIEMKLLEALSNKGLNYRFDELDLILENSTDTLVFKKVD
ncbi:META domain-containing protein [Labilibacter sediminis]|nr:META domain-containing protein [Labilibacter sediminis]